MNFPPLIGKSNFEKYERLRRSGVINMLDYISGCELTGLSEPVYREILHNYKRYARSYAPERYQELIESENTNK